MKMDHGVVFSKPGVYAGWPANHGAWSWGDELLVGFLTGTYGRAAMHNIRPPFKKLQARSLDGGATWRTEEPGVSFDCQVLHQDPLPADFSLDGSYILRVCGTYDHGGETCLPGGGFYHSKDRGKTWQGPNKFDGLEKLLEADGFLCTARTRVDHGLIYLSAGYENMWGTDYSFCASFEDGPSTPEAKVDPVAAQLIAVATNLQQVITNTSVLATLLESTRTGIQTDREGFTQVVLGLKAVEAAQNQILTEIRNPVPA